MGVPQLRCLQAQRLVASSEEVAFNDPPSGAAERMILNRHLERVLRHSRLSALQRFVQGVGARPLLLPGSISIIVQSCLM